MVWVLFQFPQNFISEIQSLLKGFLRISVLFVGKVASQGYPLAVDCYSPTLKVRELVGESGYVARVHGVFSLRNSGLVSDAY